MEVAHPRCCGLDVHKKTVAACVAIHQQGRQHKYRKRFGTTWRELQRLAEWLKEHAVTHVAMESTGVYWKPVWNVLEGQFELVLANAQLVKALEGEKTDTKDSAWIADLLQHGLLRGSFVPGEQQRDCRDLTRLRQELVQDSNRVANRIQKVLEDANIKLSSVASDTLGRSGRDMLQAMIEGETGAEKLADLARGVLRKKLQQLQAALEGRIREHHRVMLKHLLEQWEFLEGKIGEVEEEIRTQMLPFQEAIAHLDSIPGVNETVAWTLVAELGVDMRRFGSAARAAAWAGLCPGNHESAGKRLSGRTRRGNRYLRRVLVQSAWTANRGQGTYLQAQFRRFIARLGKKRTAVAVAHTILTIAYHILDRNEDYRELGGDYFERQDPQRTTRRLVRRLERLGHHVILQPATEALH
ncbi:MAG: IS110 family transposase [Cyanobacteria bacterium 13_1_20CM_4_61_6]|nr:MAG: IS110 family transposase [Cyanobacteria bacterium 13_1_20CM_4_61_6]